MTETFLAFHMASTHDRPASLVSQRLKEKMKIKVKLSEEQTKDMKVAFDLFDPDETGTIDVNGIMGKTDAEEKMTMAFHLFDDDCTGSISFENLKKVSEELGENLTVEELKEMIDFADEDRDGEVNKKEFLRMMRKPNINKSHNIQSE